VENSFDKYVEEMQKDGTWGDHLEIQVACDLGAIKSVRFRSIS
jgi:hypothetical protein